MLSVKKSKNENTSKLKTERQEQFPNYYNMQKAIEFIKQKALAKHEIKPKGYNLSFLQCKPPMKNSKESYSFVNHKNAK